MTNLLSDFHNDLDRIAISLIDNFGLKHEKVLDNLSDPLLRWLDFRLRYIDPKPRVVHLQKGFPKDLPPDVKSALDNLQGMISRGENVNAFQGKGLSLRHDPSGNKRQNRTDLLWADWGITHLHLTNFTEIEKDFSQRSGWLLFCFFTPCECAFLDVRRHGEEDLFSDSKLVEILIRNWPEYMERFRLKGVPSPQEDNRPSKKDISTLRKGGVSSFIVVDGVTYIGPGLGVTTASTPSIVTNKMIEVRIYISILVKELESPGNYYLKKIAEFGVTEPKFSLALTPEGLAIYEAKSGVAFLLPRELPGQQLTPFARLHDLIAPPWVIASVFRGSKAEATGQKTNN